MSKEHADKPYIPAREECTYLPPHLRPKVQSKIIPKVYSRIQPKLLTDLNYNKSEINKDASLEQEADTLGKRASEGKEATVRLSSEPTIQRKEEEKQTIDKGKSEHAKGEFDPINNVYIAPDASHYENPEKAFDTLYSIAKRFGVSTEAIKQTNHLTSDAVIAGQQLTIPNATSVKQEPKVTATKTDPAPVVHKENNLPVKNTPAKPKDEAAELISNHTSLLMLDEDGLAKELVAKYISNHPEVVSSILTRIEDYNRDDLAVAVLKLIPLANWKNLDKKLLKEFYNHLSSGLVSSEEELFKEHLSKILIPKVEQEKKSEPITKSVVSNISKSSLPINADSLKTNNLKEDKTTSFTNNDLFAIDKSKSNADYLTQMYDNKNEGKWQKEDLNIEKNLTEIDQRIKLAQEIDRIDKRTYQALTMTEGRLTDNYVDCAEFVSEVFWIQGHQTIPSGDCLSQLNWFKKNGEWGENFEDIKLGDVIFWDNKLDGLESNDKEFQWKGNLDHVGLVTEIFSDGKVKFIHASVNRNKEGVKNPSINDLYKTDNNGDNFIDTKYEQRFVAWARIKK